MKRRIEFWFTVMVTASVVLAVHGDTLCYGTSETTAIDLASGTRTAALTEHLRYSTDWADSAASDSFAVIEVNGEELSSDVGDGAIDWTPTRNGTFTLTYKVMAGDVQVGDTLTAVFRVVGLDTPFADGEVMVPYDWLVQYVEKYGGGDFEVAGNAQGKNGHALWESYVAGLNPEDANSKLIAYIEMQDDGSAKITWSPDLSEESVPRSYTVIGVSQLPANETDWVTVTDENRASMRFFKVLVNLK